MAPEVYRIEIPIEVVDRSGAALGQAQARVTGFERAVQRTEWQLKRMNQTRWQLALYAVDRATSVIGQVGARAWALARGGYRLTLRVLDLATSPLRAVGRLLTSTLGLLGAGAGAYGGVIWPLRLAGEFEQTEIALRAMLRSGDKARAFLTELQSFAMKTPFSFPQLLESGQLLLAFGIEAERVVPMLSAIADAAAASGKGSEGIQRIAVALGQIRTKGKLASQEMLQLTEASVPAWELLAEGLGKTTAQVQDMTARGLIPAGKALELIIEGIRRRYGGTGEQLSHGLLGLTAILRTQFTRLMQRGWGEGLRKVLVPQLQAVVDWFGRNGEAVEEWRRKLERAGETVATWVVQRIEGLRETIARLVNSPEWKEAKTLGEKLKVAWNMWWSESGRQWAENVGKGLVGAVVAGVKLAIGEGFKFSIVDPLKGGPTVGNIAKVAVGATGALAVGRFLAQPFTWLGRTLGITRGAAGAAAAAGGASAAGAAEAVAKTGLLGSVAKAAGPLAILAAGLDLWNIIAAKPGVEKAKAIGGAAGAWGGVLAGGKVGALLGSTVLPGIGTAVGGALGALAGAIGGRWLGMRAGAGLYEPAAQLTPSLGALGPTVLVSLGGVSFSTPISAAANADDVLRVIRDHQGELADGLAYEIGRAVEAGWRNMPGR